MPKARKPKAAPVQIEEHDNERRKALQPDPPDRKWIETRIAEANQHKKLIAEQLGIHINLLQNTINGKRRCQIEELIVLARLLKVTKAEMAQRMGFTAWKPDSVPVTGEIDGHGRFHKLPPPHVVEAAPGEIAAGTLEACRFASGTGPLGVYVNAVVFFEPRNDFITNEGARIIASGTLALIEIGHENASVLGYLGASSGGKGNVTVFGTGERLDVTRIMGASPVKWLKLS